MSNFQSLIKCGHIPTAQCERSECASHGGTFQKHLNSSVFVLLCIDCGRVSRASLLYQPKRTNGSSWAKRCCCFRSQPLLIDSEQSGHRVCCLNSVCERNVVKWSQCSLKPTNHQQTVKGSVPVWSPPLVVSVELIHASHTS